MLANTVRAVCAVPIVTTFVVGALVLTSLGWWLLSVLVFGGAPQQRYKPMAKKNSSAQAVDVESLDFAQPSSTRGRSAASPSVCQIARYIAKNAPTDTVGVLKVKIGDEALAQMGISLGTRKAPVKIRVEAAYGDGRLYIRQCEGGGWSLSKHRNGLREPTFAQVAFTGDLAGAVFAHAGSALNGSSVEVDWSTQKATDGILLVLELPGAPE